MKQTFYIPTYEEAQAIVKNAGELTFYESIQEVEGYKISTFNYRLASYQHFIDHKAYEMRGLCFVFNKDGSLFKRYILLHKFFNLNQVEETQYHLIKDIPFKSVHDKADGSVITFVKLPNGKVFAKTKMVVGGNDQALMAQNIYDTNPTIQRLVNYALDNDIITIFELVSPKNKVVLKYFNTELILTRLRNNNTGEYLDFDVLGDLIDDVKIVDCESLKYSSWDVLIPLVETVEEKEGWVVTLQSGQLVKLKTKWYCDRHHLLTEYVNREDYLIEMILDEKIDDVLGQLSEDDVEVRALVDVVSIRVQEYLKMANDEIYSLVQEFNTTCNMDKKTFALTHLKNPYFGLACGVISGKDQFQLIVEYLKKKCYHLEDARHFVETGKVK